MHYSGKVIDQLYVSELLSTCAFLVPVLSLYRMQLSQMLGLICAVSHMARKLVSYLHYMTPIASCYSLSGQMHI